MAKQRDMTENNRNCNNKIVLIFTSTCFSLTVIQTDTFTLIISQNQQHFVIFVQRASKANSYQYVVLGLSVTFQLDANSYSPTRTNTLDTCKGIKINLFEEPQRNVKIKIIFLKVIFFFYSGIGTLKVNREKFVRENRDVWLQENI